MMFVLVWLAMAMSQAANAKTVVTEPTNESLCMIVGGARRLNRGGSVDGKGGFDPLNRIIRIRLNAIQTDNCRDLAIYYCKHQILSKGYIGVDLKGFFRPGDGTDGEDYPLTERCELIK